MYIFGFPKSNDFGINKRISEQISVSSTCNLSSNLFDLDENKCKKEKLTLCEDLFSDYKKTMVINREITDVVLEPFENYEITNNNITKSVNSLKDCKANISIGWTLKDFYNMNKRLPYVNIFSFLLPALLWLVFRKSIVT